MGIKIDNKTYLNLPEQVEKNRVDIENLQGQGGYYTQEESDAKFETKVDHNASIVELKRAVRLIDKDLKSTKTNVNTNTNEIAVVKGDVNAVNTNIDQVTRDVSSLGTSVDAIDKKADQNSTDISNLGSAFNDLRTTTLSLNSSKQDKLKAGNNITISADNTISAQVDDVVLKPTDVFNATSNSDTIVRDIINDKVEFHVSNTVNNTINNKLDKPVGITDTELVGFNTEQVNIKIGNNLTLENNTLNAVGGGTVDAYTKAESDAKYETIESATQAHGELTTEINSVNTTQTENYNNVNNRVDALDNKVDAITPIVPTDIAVNEGKLGLKHDTTWLTNQNAINLGSNLTYDANTNTLNATGGGGTVDAYTKEESDAKYQPKGTYVVASDLEAYEKKSELTTTLENYVTTTSLTTTLGDYALKTEIPTDFYTKAQSDEKYQVKGDYALKTDIPTDFYTQNQCDTKFATKTELTSEASQRSDADINLAGQISDLDTRISELKTPAYFQTSIQYDDTMSKQYKLFYAVDTNGNPIVDNNTKKYLGFAVSVDLNLSTVTLAPNSTKNRYPCIHLVNAYSKVESDEKYQPIGDYVISTTLRNYSTTAQNDAKYQPIGSYETTADASTAHTTLSGKIDTNTSNITKLRTDVDTMSTKLGTETILRRW